MIDPVESDLRRYLKELEEADKLDEYIDNLTDKKWAEIEQGMYLQLSSPYSWDDEYQTSRIINGGTAESACCFDDLIREHLESERFSRLLAELIASPAGENVRTSLVQLHAASHAHNLAKAEAALLTAADEAEARGLS